MWIRYKGKHGNRELLNLDNIDRIITTSYSLVDNMYCVKIMMRDNSSRTITNTDLTLDQANAIIDQVFSSIQNGYPIYDLTGKE